MCFNQLQKSEAKSKAMIESWVMSERTYEPNKTFYSYGTSFDQIGSMGIDNQQIYHQNNPMQATKDSYQEYSWLFARKR
jgi:hypothetical protein